MAFCLIILDLCLQHDFLFFRSFELANKKRGWPRSSLFMKRKKNLMTKICLFPVDQLRLVFIRKLCCNALSMCECPQNLNVQSSQQ
jgi:hypothetical protein